MVYRPGERGLPGIVRASRLRGSGPSGQSVAGHHGRSRGRPGTDNVMYANEPTSAQQSSRRRSTRRSRRTRGSRRLYRRRRAGGPGAVSGVKLGAYSSCMSGLERTKSAVARLQAIGMLWTTAIRSSAFTSTSCGCGESGSQKKITASIRPFGDRGADLLVAAERAAQEAVHRQPELLGDQAAGRAGGEQVVLGQRPTVEPGPGEHVGLAVVVRDQRDAFARSDATLLSDDGDRLFHQVQLMRRPVPCTGAHALTAAGEAARPRFLQTTARTRRLSSRARATSSCQTAGWLIVQRMSVARSTSRPGRARSSRWRLSTIAALIRVVVGLDAAARAPRSRGRSGAAVRITSPIAPTRSFPARELRALRRSWRSGSGSSRISRYQSRSATGTSSRRRVGAGSRARAGRRSWSRTRRRRSSARRRPRPRSPPSSSPA